MFLFRNSHFLWHRFWTCSIMALSIISAGFIGLDAFLRPYFQRLDFPVWEWFDFMGDWKMLAMVSIMVFAGARIFRWVKGKRIFVEKLSANVFCSIILGEFIVMAVKILVGRARPPFEAFAPFSLSAAWHSFPSGHAAAAFAMLVSIGLRYPKIKGLTWTFAILVAAGQVCLDAHYLSDVVAGAFIGMLAADLIVLARRRITAMSPPPRPVIQ